MELLLGIHVREHGYRIGRLAGVEVERGTQQVRRIFLSADGDMGSHAQTRPLAAVPIDHFSGDIVLRAFPISAIRPRWSHCFSVVRHASSGAVIRSAGWWASRCRQRAVR